MGNCCSANEKVPKDKKIEGGGPPAIPKPQSASQNLQSAKSTDQPQAAPPIQ